MSTKTLLAIGAGIAVVASAALVVPSIAFGVAPTLLSPAGYVAEIADETDDGPGNNGKGNAFGHDKDSEDFPGNNGNRGDDEGVDGPDNNRGGNGNGNAFGHDKDSEDFPGKGNENDQNGDGPGNNGKGNAFGHDRDSEDFPGNNGQGNGNDDAEDGDDD